MPQRGGKASLVVRVRGGWVMRKRYVAPTLQVLPAQDTSRVVYVVRVRSTESGDWATLVKAGRIAMGISQQALADAVGVSRSTVVRWEANTQKPENAEVVGKVAEVIRDDYDRLMRAAGLALAPRDAAPEPDPRLRGLDPNDRVVKRILALNITEELRDRALERHRRKLAEREQQDMEDLELLLAAERNADQESGRSDKPIRRGAA